MHSTYGLFLTSTQNLIYIYTTHNQSSIKKNPFRDKKKKENTSLLGGLVFFAHVGKSPSTLVPCLVATAHPLILTPFTPFPPLGLITLFTMTTSTVPLTRRGVWDAP